LKKSRFIILALCIVGLAYLLLPGSGSKQQLAGTAGPQDTDGQVLDAAAGVNSADSSQAADAEVDEGENLVASLPEGDKASYLAARQASIKGKFQVTREELHTLLVNKPEVLEQVVSDNGFRKFRETDDFRKLLLILGKDPHQELGLPPIHLE